MWEVSQKVKKTCSESAGRRGRGEGGRGGRGRREFHFYEVKVDKFGTGKL